MSRKLIILDRDNTINEDPGYLKDPAQVKLLPGVGEGLSLLKNFGYEFVVATNQSGISRGYFTYQELEAVNRRIEELLRSFDVNIRGWYICPHKDEDNCNCRKPKSGLIEEILKKEQVLAQNCYIIGDRVRDILAAEKFSMAGILIQSRETEDKEVAKNLIFRAMTFSEAVSFILKRDFEEHFKNKIFFSYEEEEFKSWLREIKNSQKRIVSTNGCFDILHIGHMQYLYLAAQLGDVLVVGLNSDSSVRQLKGNERPLNSFIDRAFLLAGFPFISAVVQFAEERPLNFLRKVKPDIHVKGGDYRPQDLPEKEIVESFGGRVVILPFRQGYSTTRLVEKIKANKEA
ncbi:MAG: HAD-IIIA family hydrolase [Leptospiraceae bacterium]|nr:HAD-IIIA family hydrolase [Leptospiraceae bacterium]MDW8307168.1 HAD-IIIA family hydrolase [Leptospiraceae bacterium]